MSQNYVYPSSSDVTVTGIGTPNNQPIPSDSVLVAGENPSGNQEVLQTDSAGNLKVALVSDTVSPLNVNVIQYGSATTTLGQKTSAASQPVVLASDQSSIPVTQATASSLNATVVQPTASALNATVSQGTAANLLAQVSQPTAASLNATVVQATATNLNASVSQATATALNATVVQPTAASLNATVVQGTAANLKTNAFLGTPTALTVHQAAVTVGTTAVRLTVSGSAPASTRVVLVGTPDQSSTALFYIGSSTVTNSGATRGVEIIGGQSFIANNDAGDYWIVSSLASQTVTIMEQS